MFSNNSGNESINTQSLENPFTFSSYRSASLLPHLRVLRQKVSTTYGIKH